MDRITDTAALGGAIRARRKELGYTQAFIADYVEVMVAEGYIEAKDLADIILSKHSR